MKSRGPYKKNYERGIRGEIIKLIYACGIIPEKSLVYLENMNYKTMRMKIKEMMNETVLEYYKRGRMPRVILLNAESNERSEYEKAVSKEQLAYYWKTGKQDENKVTSKKKKISETERVIYNIDTVLFMYGIGIKVKIAEKNELAGTIEKSVYYTSRILKTGMGKEQRYGAEIRNKNGEIEIGNSRLRGMLCSKGGVYGVYRMSTNGTYSQNGEYKMKLYLERLTSDMENGRELKDAIVIANVDRKKIMENMIAPEENRRKIRFASIEAIYRHVYCIPADKNGQQMMKVFTCNGWKEKIYESFGLPQSSNRNGVVCDGSDDDHWYYVFCIPDIKRFQKFKARAEIENDREQFIVICFDWQVPLVKNVIGRYARIKSVPFEKYLKELQFIE